MKELVSVIDLGTNTFHIIIVHSNDGLFEEIFRSRIFVNLAEDGMDKISDAARQRALDAVNYFHRKLLQYSVKKVKVFGTAALRTASNGPQLIDEILQETGLKVQMIDGNREADLIFKGTALVVPMSGKKNLIMDVGGGSVEFILSMNGQIAWKRSYEIGVTVLYNRFRNSDPILSHEIDKIHQYLDEELHSLKSILAVYQIDSLVGASGSFEVMQKMVSGRLYKSRAIHYNIAQFMEIYDLLVYSTLEERLAMPRLIKERANLVVVAFILIRYILEIADIPNIIVSPYALKEGALSELI